MLEPAQIVGFIHVRRRVARRNEEDQHDEQHFHPRMRRGRQQSLCFSVVSCGGCDHRLKHLEVGGMLCSRQHAHASCYAYPRA